MRRLLILLALVSAAPLLAAPDSDPAATAKRVGKLESEMRAVQRKVFPGGDPKFFTPDISSAPVAAPAEPSGNPASAPINDLTARVDALERQLRTLTGQVEENQNTLKQVDTSLTKLRGDTEFRLTKLEGGTPAAGAGAAGSPASGGAATTDLHPSADSSTGNTAASGNPDASSGAPSASPFGGGRSTAPATATPGKSIGKPGTRAAADKPADKPVTGDPVEAAWRAAHAQYAAKDYDAAESGFTDYLAANPKSSHASTAQYLLGRSYAAQSSSAQAAKAFLDGYQKYPKSEQAPDSLIGLGNALTALKKPDQACRALNELKSVYGSKLTAAQKAQAAKARTSAKCES